MRRPTKYAALSVALVGLIAAILFAVRPSVTGREILVLVTLDTLSFDLSLGGWIFSPAGCNNRGYVAGEHTHDDEDGDGHPEYEGNHGQQPSDDIGSHDWLVKGGSGVPEPPSVSSLSRLSALVVRHLASL